MDGPIIGATAGAGFTVSTAVRIQPLVAVKVMMVVPGETPVIAPEKLALATAGLLLNQETVGVVASVRIV